jgi:hypothetical protein
VSCFVARSVDARNGSPTYVPSVVLLAILPGRAGGTSESVRISSQRRICHNSVRHANMPSKLDHNSVQPQLSPFAKARFRHNLSNTYFTICLTRFVTILSNKYNVSNNICHLSKVSHNIVPNWFCHHLSIKYNTILFGIMLSTI